MGVESVDPIRLLQLIHVLVSSSTWDSASRCLRVPFPRFTNFVIFF
jgi:hypothetical protein